MFPKRVQALIRQPISFLERSGLGTRAQNALERAGYKTVGDVLSRTRAELQEVSGYDVATHRQLLAALVSEGVFRVLAKEKINVYPLRKFPMIDLFEDKRFNDSSEKIVDALQKLEGSVKVGMTAEGQVHPQSLISILMGIKESQIHSQQQVAILSSLLRAMAKHLPEDSMEKVLEDFEADIDAKVTHFEELQKKRTEKERTPKLVVPAGNVGNIK